MRRFPATLARGHVVGGVAFTLAMLLVGAAPALVAAALGDPNAWLALAGLPAPAIAFVVWALSPRAVLVGSGIFGVERRRWRRVEVPLWRIRRVALLPPEAIRGALRVAGSSGVFGNYGVHWSSSLGVFRLYATRPDGFVLVDTDRTRFVVSPDEPEAFAEALRERAPPSTSSDRPARSDRAPGGGRRILLTIAAAVGIPAALIGVVLVGGWAWAPRGIEVVGEAIHIRRNYSGVTEIPLSTLRAVEVLERERLRGASRSAGYAFRGTAYGRFVAPTLGTFRLEQHRPRGPWVLVEGEERWVLTPDDPEAFVAAARARMGPRDR